MLARCLRVQGMDIDEEFIDRATSSELSNDHPYSDAHATDAGFATHHSRLVSDAIQICHGSLYAAGVSSL